MIKELYGDVAEHLNGMMVRKSSLGWNPNLKEYPYDPDKAKQLMQEAGGWPDHRADQPEQRRPTRDRGGRAGRGPDRPDRPEGGDQVAGARPVATLTSRAGPARPVPTSS